MAAQRQAPHGHTLNAFAGAGAAAPPVQRCQRGSAQTPSWRAASGAGRHRGRRCRSSDDPGLSARGSGLAVRVAGGT